MGSHWAARLGVVVLGMLFLASLIAQEWHGIMHPDVDAAQINRRNQTARSVAQRQREQRESEEAARAQSVRIASASPLKRAR